VLDCVRYYPTDSRTGTGSASLALVRHSQGDSMNSIGLTDNGTALIGQGQGDSRAERQQVWRLAVWHARQAQRRAWQSGDAGTVSRLSLILSGAIEGTPPARLEPVTIAHESRGLHSIVMHPSRCGMVRGSAQTRRGSLDPQSIADTMRGQGQPQTRADYSADRALASILRAEGQGETDWRDAEARAARALYVAHRAVHRLRRRKTGQGDGQ